MDGWMGFVTDEQLLLFLRRKKTELSCMEQPHAFLRQMRDHKLVKEDMFKKVVAMRSREKIEKGVYEILEQLEKEKPTEVRSFWKCVFTDSILQRYPALRQMKDSLVDGSFVSEMSSEKPDEAEAEKIGEGKETKKSSAKKRKADDDPGPSSPVMKKSAKKLSFSPLKKGDQQEMWKWPLYRIQLPVTCGDKEGILHRDKLAEGDKCIKSGKRWFTPTQFEKFGGKESWKNWKLSIRCKTTPLKSLIESGDLQCPDTRRRTRRCAPKDLTEKCSSSAGGVTNDGSESSSRTTVESDAEDFQELSGTKAADRREDEEEEEEDEGEVTDLKLFQDPSLPVSFSSLTGTLHKYRFATGSRSKCIRTEKRWFTPEEFVKEDPALTEQNWRRDILCHGRTLHFLITKKILNVHSLLCKCVKCSEEKKKTQDENNDDQCWICDSPEDVVCCDDCPRAFHPRCHLPVVNPESQEKWLCTFCVLETSRQWRFSSHMTEEEAMKAPVSEYKLYCHCLLMCVYKNDAERIFVKDPRKTVRRYSVFVQEPMWLDRIKQKLEADQYPTVGDFVSDVQLVFRNCRNFNRDTEYGPIGKRQKERFEEEFQKIFTIQ